MSTERRPELHTDLLAALAGDGDAARGLRERASTPPATPPGDPGEPLVPAATSAHRRAVAAALSGAPVLVDAPTGAGALVAELLVALAADGRRVLHLADPAGTAAVRAELAGLGLAGLLADEDTAPPAQVPDPGQDEPRRQELAALLHRRTSALHTRPGDGGPTPFEALAELGGLRTGHLHPPLLPAAAAWGEQRRTEVAALLAAARTGHPEQPPAGSAEQAEDLLGALDPLPAALEALTAGTGRLDAELSWRPLRTLGDAERALALLERVETAQRTYLPLALTADLDQVRAVLTQQQRSFLSAEERTRRREVKRLAALRHDGRFGLRDVEELTDLRAAWAQHAAGPLRTWPTRAELARQLTEVRRLLAAAAAALPPLPEPAELELAQLGDLATRAAQERDAAHDAHQRRQLADQGLQELAEAVPAGASTQDVALLVRATWLRARADAALADLDAAADRPGELAAEFRALDLRRSLAGARRLREALADSSAPRCRVTGGHLPGGDALEGEEFDVLVVDGAHRRAAEDVLALARRARQVVAVGEAAGAGTGDGSAWSALAALLPVQGAGWPAAPEHAAGTAVREAVAASLRAAGLVVTTGREVAGYPVDLLVASSAQAGEPVLAVDLDGVAHHALPTVRDREVARAEQLQDAGLVPHRVWSGAWFRDPRGEVQRVVEALRGVEEAERAAREEAERAAREEAERAAREEAERAAREEAERAAREEAE
ncbi:hypothetical protein, partial [Kineococcus auxinigenes]|uniref:hypothetical protein n=1 Tax=unclassified Kineococcus TaxID=2621656 RepID=UPI003D7DF317